MSNDDSKRKKDHEISAAIRYACKRNFGVLDSNFMCQSLSILSITAPICVHSTDSVISVINTLRANKGGCVLVLDSSDKLVGIFSERDCVLKIIGQNIDLQKVQIAEYMTKDPVCQPPDCTIAYALNLMSQGGFRNLPVVNDEGTILGVVSTKDVVDYIVTSFTEDLLTFNTDLDMDLSGDLT